MPKWFFSLLGTLLLGWCLFSAGLPVAAAPTVSGNISGTVTYQYYEHETGLTYKARFRRLANATVQVLDANVCYWVAVIPTRLVRIRCPSTPMVHPLPVTVQVLLTDAGIPSGARVQVVEVTPIWQDVVQACAPIYSHNFGQTLAPSCAYSEGFADFLSSVARDQTQTTYTWFDAGGQWQSGYAKSVSKFYDMDFETQVKTPLGSAGANISKKWLLPICGIYMMAQMAMMAIMCAKPSAASGMQPFNRVSSGGVHLISISPGGNTNGIRTTATRCHKILGCKTDTAFGSIIGGCCCRW
jgi:hypothetical protein